MSDLVAQKYSEESILALMKGISSKTDQIVGMMELFSMMLDDNDHAQQVLLQGVSDIKKTTSEINAKMDQVLERMTRLETDFADIKNENRNMDQKLSLMTLKLSKLEESVQTEEYEDYYALSQSLYENWEEFDSLTRKFIPISEYLYSKLQKYDKPDYSPVILELCRAIENEFLTKIFREYTLDLIKRKGNNLDSFLSSDRKSYEMKYKTGQFVKAVSKAAKTHKPEYTLGQMNTILSYASNDEIVLQSPLLHDFVEYLSRNTEASDLLSHKYTAEINEIVKDYRNPSAHPEFMSMEKAEKCRKIMPDRLDHLMDCLN